MKEKTIYCYDLDEVEEITLLSAEEWEEVKKIKNVPQFTGWWWLRSPGYYSTGAADVDYDGGISSYDDRVNYSDVCVRPAFRCLGFPPIVGEKVFVGNTLCTVIDADYALSDNAICQHRFDSESNDFEKSEIKAFLNSDKFKEML